MTDSGTGMAPDVLARAFDPFFTTKTPGKGTGLGLSQVYGFVKQSEGHVKIDSQPGRGTAVRIYLPRYLGNEMPTHSAAPREPQASRPNRETVLVVEDEDGVRSMTVEALRSLGYTVIAAAGPEHALDLLDEGARAESALHGHRHAGHGRACAGGADQGEAAGNESAVHDRLHAGRRPCTTSSRNPEAPCCPSPSPSSSWRPRSAARSMPDSETARRTLNCFNNSTTRG